jgi:hypothetical protein
MLRVLVQWSIQQSTESRAVHVTISTNSRPKASLEGRHATGEEATIGDSFWSTTVL